MPFRPGDGGVDPGMSPHPDRLIFGTNPLSTMPSRRAAFRLLETALDVGISHFDTARAYGQGYGERLVGEFARAHGASLDLTAKVGLGPFGSSRLPTWAALPANAWRRRLRTSQAPSASAPRGPARRPPPLSSDDARRYLDATLRSLRVDRVHTLLLHERLPAALDDRALDFFVGLRRDGVVGELGTGTNAFVLDAYYEPVEGFTVLQYEGAGADGLPDLGDRFPDHTHYRHGFLRDLGGADPAAVLAAAQTEIPSGKVLFSTRSVDRLRQNVRPSS